jgi:RNA polymerase sigma factor (sigma-70 family)
VGERDLVTERFEQQRSHLQRVAFRMLGSVTEAEDAVQEAWFRIRDEDPESIRSLQAWLTTVVSRVCLNRLRSRRSRPEVLTDFHVPDPVVTFHDDVTPEHEAVLGDSVGLALLVVLDTLTPAERVAFVLHDLFRLPFVEVAAILDRSEAAAQQLASRARRRVSTTPKPDRDLGRQRRLVEAFFAASRDGDFSALMEVLDPDVELRIDGGIRRAEASLHLRGAHAVARHTATYAQLHPYVRPARVNGTAGAVIVPGGALFSVMAFTVAHRRIIRIDGLVDPDRLARLGLDVPGSHDKT